MLTQASQQDVASERTELTIIIPAFNEETGIQQTLRTLRREARLADAAVIVIDDGSTDRTAEIAAGEGVTVVQNRTNLGYGASIKRGVQLARTNLVAWFDADGQHDPSDLAEMVDRLHREHADAVFGRRVPGSHVVKSRVLGKKITTFAAERAVGQVIGDVNCGLRVFRRQVLERYVHLLPNGFSASTSTTLIFLQRNCHVIFHPVLLAERRGTSSVKQLRDGLRTVHTILRILILFNAFRSFSLVAGVLVLSGLVYGFTVALIQRLGFPVFGALLIIAGVQIFFMGLVCDQISAMRMEKLEGPQFAQRPPDDALEPDGKR